MLVLSRKLHEGITIEGGIHITVVELPYGGVKLGIDAPGLRIDRDEVAAAIAAQGFDPRGPIRGGQGRPHPQGPDRLIDPLAPLAGEARNGPAGVVRDGAEPPYRPFDKHQSPVPDLSRTRRPGPGGEAPRGRYYSGKPCLEAIRRSSELIGPPDPRPSGEDDPPIAGHAACDECSCSPHGPGEDLADSSGGNEPDPWPAEWPADDRGGR
jgi:carbon storage regulator CsrA